MDHTVPPFPDRASDSNVGCDSGCVCCEKILVRKMSRVVVLQVVSRINRNMDLRDPSHLEIASQGRHMFAGLCHHSCETSSLQPRQQTLLVNIHFSSFTDTKVSQCGH